MTYAESLKKEGIQLGEQKGRQESQLEIAKKMLNAGFEQQKVVEFTNLSLEQIKTLH
ncbi:MAG: hypothetical protein KGH75_13615 [Rhodospirillales bacterium]|nr:hypothetical protein [Rhodospirillales bacterium]